MIRHGQSEADILGVHEGRADFPLTELGERQAQAMARWIKERFDIQKIFASPLKRASQTAGYLAEAYGIVVSYDDDLMEFQNGMLAGLPFAEARERFPRIELPPHAALYGMESHISFRMRAETALSRLLSENDPNAVIAVVAHGGIINMLYRSFLELPIAADFAFSTGDTGIHYWQTTEKKRRIVFANNLSHLERV